jgi:hypothetical protein
VTPAWGQKAKRQRSDARYIEISPAGHCEYASLLGVLGCVRVCLARLGMCVFRVDLIVGRTHTPSLLFSFVPVANTPGPHHEAPETVNALVSEWIAEQEQAKATTTSGDSSDSSPQANEDVRVFKEAITGREVRATFQDGRPRDVLEWLVAATILR